MVRGKFEIDMKTLNEILKNNSPYGIVIMEDWQLKSIKEYATEVAKEALKNASECFDDYRWTGHENADFKQSILSETNIPKI